MSVCAFPPHPWRLARRAAQWRTSERIRDPRKQLQRHRRAERRPAADEGSARRQAGGTHRCALLARPAPRPPRAAAASPQRGGARSRYAACHTAGAGGSTEHRTALDHAGRGCHSAPAAARACRIGCVQQAAENAGRRELVPVRRKSFDPGFEGSGRWRTCVTQRARGFEGSAAPRRRRLPWDFASSAAWQLAWMADGASNTLGVRHCRVGRRRAAQQAARRA